MPPKVAIVLFNLGGPDNTEAIRPFLLNLFNDPAILRVPFFVRPFLARKITSARLQPATAAYQLLGGKSPLRGMTEAQAKEKGYEVKVGKFPFAGNSKATIVDSHDGFVKIVSDAKYGEILGVHILGPQATELIAEAVAVLELEGTVEELMYTIHAHPTLAESLLDAYGAVNGMAINA